MNVNNFTNISEHLNFDIERDKTFYLVQIFLRKKDFDELGIDVLNSNNLIVHTLYIQSKEDLFKKEKLIKYLCDSLKARAYISVNKYSFENTGYKFLGKIGEQFENKNFKALRRSYDSSVIKSKKIEKRRIIDIDTLNQKSIEYQFFEQYLNKNGIKYFINYTPHGFHLISEPFNIQQIQNEINVIEDEKEKFLIKGVNIHKDNPTILYTSI